VIDGRPAARGAGGRLRRRAQRLLVSGPEREEAELERLIRARPDVTRPNVLAVISPKGGVGKTTLSFLTGSLLANRLTARVVCVDANPDFGTLTALAPDTARCERSLVDLLEGLDGVATLTQLRPYLSQLSTGLDLISGPAADDAPGPLSPDRYGELVAFLGVFYDLVILDCGSAITGPLARFALTRADQIVLVTTPESLSFTAALAALEHLPPERTSVALNMCSGRTGAQTRALEQHLRRERVGAPTLVPYDGQLRGMLDSGTYSLEALPRKTRLAVKRLGLAAAEALV